MGKKPVGSKYYAVFNKQTTSSMKHPHIIDYLKEVHDNKELHSFIKKEAAYEQLLQIEKNIFDKIRIRLGSIIKKINPQDQKKFYAFESEISFSFLELNGKKFDVLFFLKDGTHREIEFLELKI
jgi:hypothetical protein